MFLLTRNYLNESQFCAVTTSIGRAVRIARQYLAIENRPFCCYEVRDVQINWPEDWAMRSQTRFEGPLHRRPRVVLRKADVAADTLLLFFPDTGLSVAHKFASSLY